MLGQQNVRIAHAVLAREDTCRPLAMIAIAAAGPCRPRELDEQTRIENDLKIGVITGQPEALLEPICSMD